MSSLLVFNRVYRVENGDTVSHVGIFDPSCELAPSNLLTGSPTPSPPFPVVNKYKSMYSYSV
jgi:hypothetical protein